MKKVDINKLNIWTYDIKNYTYSIILTLVIFILFCIMGYSNNIKEYKLYINDSKTNLTYGIYNQKGEQYIHIEDLTNVFSDSIYNDKISGKLILTTYDKYVSIEKNDKNYTIILDAGIYFNLKKIVETLSLEFNISLDKIYVSNNKYITGLIKYNRTEILDSKTHDVISFLKKGDNVNIVVNENLKSSNIVDIIVTSNNTSYYGYMLKDNVKYEYEEQEKIEQKEKVILVKADEKLMSSTDVKYVDMVAIDMYRLSGVSTLTKLEYTNNVPKGVQIFATINNGQTSANFDSDITTRMLNSQSNREQIIKTIVEETGGLNGVCIDFSSLKLIDKDNFTQYIKELAAALHAKGKKIIVNISNTKNIDLVSVTKAVDYVVICPYTARTINSKTSGPISSINYIESVLSDVLKQNIDKNKIILEIPAYSILWTERKGTVINAEKYSMKMIKEYLELNNIVSTLDDVSGQNYINYTKGITTYKMWLEDEYSAIEKTKIVNKYNLAGISIYKSGMELNEIYESISNTLKER